jgi:hypothetical protein
MMNKHILNVAAAILLGTGVASADYKSTVVADGPVSYWPLNETNGPIIHDIFGTNNGTMFTATLPGGTLPGATNDGSAFQMGGPGLLDTVPADTAIYFSNATNAEIVVPYSSELDTATWSAEGWFNVPVYPITYNPAVYGSPLSFSANNSPGQAGWAFDVVGNQYGFNDTDGTVQGWAAHSGGAGWTQLAPVSANNYNGEWVYCVMTYDGTTLRLYQQGNLILSQAAGYETVISGGLPQPLLMGAQFNTATALNDWYLGGVEQVAVYNYPLSPAQILNHYTVALQPTYSSTIAGDLPTSYWPLNETNGPLIHDVIGTNMGTMFTGTNLPAATNDGSAFQMGGPGVLFGVYNDTAIYFSNATNGEIVVPYSSELDTATWSAEAWFNIPAYPITYNPSVYGCPLSFSANNSPGQAGWVFDVVGNQYGFNGTDGTVQGWAAHSGGAGWTQLQPTSVNNYNPGWVHCVMTYDGTTLRLYQQGNLILSQATGYETVIGGGLMQPLLMGAQFNNATALNDWYLGGEEQVAVYNYALSASQILNHYNIGKLGPVVPASIGTQPPAGFTNYVGYTPAPLTVAAGGTPPLSYQWYLDNVPIAGATSSALALSHLQVSDSGTYDVTVSNSLASVTSSNTIVEVLPLPTNAYQALVISEFPEAYYPMDETNGTVAYDLIGTEDCFGEYLGTFTLGVAGPGGNDLGPAVGFDGASAYVEITNQTVMEISGQLTLEAWAQIQETNGTQIIVAHGPYQLANPSDIANELGIMTTNNQACYFVGNVEEAYLLPGGGGFTNAGYESFVTNAVYFPIPASDVGTWVHLVGATDGTTWRLYKNGVEITNTPNPGGALLANGGWSIGAINNFFSNSGPGAYFDGAINNVAIYDYALTAGMVKQHYQVGLTGQGSDSIPTTVAIQSSVQASGTSIVMTWSNGYLQQATSLQGPWTYVAGATSPDTIAANASESAMYFRITLVPSGTPGAP